MLLDFFEPQMFTMTVYTKLILFAAIMDLGLAMIVWLGTKRYSARIFVLIPLIQTVWNINHALMHSKTASAEIQHFLLNNSHFLGVILVSIAAYFALTFPEDKKPSKKILFSI
ncbi:MAG: hypothetical protein KAS07_00620, partial [Candidatus Pacebacteria bacterium]|nr:hypothetical protein [Candidatus Paceibacterota bacterium]